MFRRPIVRVAVLTAAVLGVFAGSAGFGGPAASQAHIIGRRGVIVARGFLVLVNFTDAKCSMSKGAFTATATGLNGADVRLHVHIASFDGFDTKYPLSQGRSGARIVKTFISFEDSRRVDFASNFIPPYPVASLGEINFADGGRLIGVGFHPMFNSTGSEAVTVTGVMTCHYPKKKKKR